ncbi:MAG: T9SS type A sorting domain-containing protein [Bacteroidetes bacterium]|nr:T9SS type A sorting domain-containing protein [Bacteroidota bacterium]MBU1579918.1 T9SS type A sorting domain-containing protein [Bacteroidota bacterium]
MKKLASLLIGVKLLCCTPTFGQNYFPFPDSNAIWNTVGNNIFTSGEFRTRYGLFGDTIINSTPYHKIYDLFDTNLIHKNSSYFAAMRLEEKKVIIQIQDFPETILYDFSLNVGDTIWYEIGGCAYSSGCDLWPQSHWKTVTAIDTITIDNGDQRKRWHLESDFMSDTWIEGIGSVAWYGLFNPIITDILTNGDNFYFACLKQNEQVVYLNNPLCNVCFCQLYTEIAQTKCPENRLTVFPNPAKDRIIIQYNDIDKRMHSLKIFNSLGITLFEKHVHTDNKLEISVGEFLKGFYTVIVFDKSKQIIGLNKFIKE